MASIIAFVKAEDEDINNGKTIGRAIKPRSVRSRIGQRFGQRLTQSQKQTNKQIH